MAGSGVKTVIGIPFIHLSEVNSTNIYAMEQLQAKLAEHGAVFFSDLQTAGKGQMGKNWESEAGKNLLLSVILNTSSLNMGDQFALSAAVALATHDFLSSYIPYNLTIKWPNDLYWCDRKAGGILIENQISGGIWTHAIAGIGININQTLFSETTTRAVSLKQITGQQYNPVELAKVLCQNLEKRFHQLLFVNGPAEIIKDYNLFLYKKGELVKLKTVNSTARYRIDNVDQQGRLCVTGGIPVQFKHGTVEWIIEAK
ncbi:MAG: hypothetical protein RI983_1641 [Bacteroidota bacterium]